MGGCEWGGRGVVHLPVLKNWQHNPGFGVVVGVDCSLEESIVMQCCAHSCSSIAVSCCVALRCFSFLLDLFV